MYFSRVTIKLDRLPYMMQQKMQHSGQYAIHQWLWQLFPDETKRSFLFREEETGKHKQYYLLSDVVPLTNHELFTVETKPYVPQLTVGMTLAFSLRVNPVIVKKGKRCDVMMNAKYLAKQQGLAPTEIKIRQDQAALEWLVKQGEKKGFALIRNEKEQLSCNVTGYYQHQFKKREEQKTVTYSSVDFNGILTVTDTALFLDTLYTGIGKSKGFGCGLFLIKRN